ncbi:MAG: MerR family DNA-binding protein [Streptosporangiales bacterium]|nr:MerR family DNA-binding protein [Streptosporangiales bacterium]
MRIGVLAASAGVTAKTVRFYEQAGLLPGPPRTASGYRDYPPEAADRLVFIREAAAAGLTLAEIRGVLAIRDAGRPPCRHVSALIDSHLDQVDRRIAELLATRTALRTLQERARAVDPEECTEDDICSILTPTPR